MRRDLARIERVQNALERDGLDALVCALPSNVLMLSGYWPVIGTSLVVVTRAGDILLLVPEDEMELAEQGWADKVLTFSTGSLEEIQSLTPTVSERMAEVARELEFDPETVLGYEDSDAVQPVSYAGMHFYGSAIPAILEFAVPDLIPSPASDLLAELRSILTASEIKRLRIACRTAERAFVTGAHALRIEATESEIASAFRAPLSAPPEDERIQRADGWTWCMSGPNSFEAYAAFQRSRWRHVTPGDFVLVHCNSFVDGFWTDITRTFCLGQPDSQKRDMYEAVFAARDATLDAVRPGVEAAEVDHAAREVLTERGFGADFKHPTGHGVGFAAIDHHALPRLHPASKDVLAPGMVFNIEPGIYLEGMGGLRHCDMVLVTATGREVLTPFQSSLSELVYDVALAVSR
jgi:Xaa-Pro dipeptidase